MADLSGFDANLVEPTTPFEPIPAGKYLAVITESGWKPNKAGTGQYLQMTFEILEGTHKGHRLWERLNLIHPTPKAVEIAKAKLSAVCRAVGVLAPCDSAAAGRAGPARGGARLSVRLQRGGRGGGDPVVTPGALLAAALRYAGMGYRVFPCAPGGKHPLTGHGFHDATADPDQIERWWARHPSANVGIATEGLIVIDVDGQANAWPGDDPSGCSSWRPGRWR
jgi:hypothetical protein